MARILVIGDLHAPVTHPGYLPFCRDLRDKYQCNEVVFIGDCVDHHSISKHEKSPEADSGKREYELSLPSLAAWCKAFPVARVCIGNHDDRIIKMAASVGISAAFIRSYKEIWDTPDWEWEYEFILDDVYYFHGTGNGGLHPAFGSMRKMLMSVVQGHIHSAAGIKWLANPQRRIFGMDVGCGIDDKAAAFAYGKHQKQRSILSAGVVLDGIPYHEIMPMGEGEKYNKRRFKDVPAEPPPISGPRWAWRQP